MPEYLMYQLELIKNESDFDRGYRPSLINMRDLTISLPTKSDGSFDVEAQKGELNKIMQLNPLKTSIREIKEELVKMNIIIHENEIGKNIRVQLKDENLFDINNGERITKKDIQKAKGDIPVYSASIFEDEVLGYVSDKIIDFIENARSFDGINLTVNADGSDYSTCVRKHKFYANDVCNVITLKNPEIDPYYVKHELQTQILLKSLDYSFKLYKKKLGQMEIRIPLSTDGSFDLSKQKIIANKHEEICRKNRNLLTN